MDKKQVKKNEILKKSIEVMYLKGYNGTSVQDITDAAGIPKGSFYNYFKNKEHYAVDALRYYFLGGADHPFEIFKNKKRPFERFDAIAIQWEV